MYTSSRESVTAVHMKKNKNMCESIRIRKTKNNGAETYRNYISFDYSMIHEQCIDAMLRNMTHRNNSSRHNSLTIRNTKTIRRD